MGRKKKDPKEVLVTVGLKIKPTVEETIGQIAKSLNPPRNRTDVRRLLFMRGLAAYQRDGELSEPEKGMPNVIPLRIVGRVSAGHPIEAVFNEEWIEVAPSELEGVRNPRALRVVGDSMIDAMVLDGDIIIVGDVGEPAGKIVVAEIVGEGVTLKRWRQNGNRVILEPANPDYKSRIISGNKVKALAVLVKSIRFYKPAAADDMAADAA